MDGPGMNKGKKDKKQEEVKYPVGEEGLTLGGQRNSFSDFEFNLRIEKIRKNLQSTIEEIVNLQNMIYWHTRDEE
jgi:hypothetical protein